MSRFDILYRKESKVRVILCNFRSGRRWGERVDTAEFLAVWTGRVDGYDPWIWGLYRCELCNGPCWASLFFTEPRYRSDATLNELGLGIRRRHPLSDFVLNLEREANRKMWWVVKGKFIEREWEECVCHDDGYEGDGEDYGGREIICKKDKCQRICFGQYLDNDTDSSDADN